jgi:hypothetical protein
MSRIRLYGDTSGYVEFKAPDVADNNTVTFPNSPVVEMLANQNQIIEAQAPEITPIIIKGANSQTANLIEFKNNSDTTLASISSLGIISASSFSGNVTGNLTGNITGESTVNISASTVAISNNLAVDTSTLFVDSVNDRVGIGTSSPSSLLHATNDSASGDIRIRLGTTNFLELIRNGANDNWLRGTGGSLIIDQASNGIVAIRTNSVERMQITSAGHCVPSTTNTYDLGTTSLRWRNIYTQDLHLSNGIGDYTIVEGEEDLFLTNNKNGKSYKFALIEVDSSEVPLKSEQ